MKSRSREFKSIDGKSLVSRCSRFSFYYSFVCCVNTKSTKIELFSRNTIEQKLTIVIKLDDDEDNLFDFKSIYLIFMH